MPLSEIRDLILLHTSIAQGLRTALDGRPRPAVHDRIAIVGPDPIRVLLVGAGLAVGYGVTTAADGFGGAIARSLAGLTERGVSVEHRVQADLPMRQTVELLGAVGAHSFDLVVWCPTFTELTKTWRLRRWLVDLRMILGELVASGDRRTSYLLMGFPTIDDPGFVEEVATSFVHRANARIARAAQEFSRTWFVYPPPAVHIGRALDADYYARTAAVVTPHMVRALKELPAITE